MNDHSFYIELFNYWFKVQKIHPAPNQVGKNNNPTSCPTKKEVPETLMPSALWVETMGTTSRG